MEVLCANACVGDAAVSFLRVDPNTAAPTTAQDAGAQAPLGASVAGLAADAAAQPAPRHAHSHLLHIIQHQQERIARLTAALAHSAASHQHVTDALGRVQQPPHRCGGACSAAPATHAAVRLSVDSVSAAASAAVRWADVAATVTDAAAAAAAAADAGGPLSTEADGEAAAHHEAPVDAVPRGSAPGVSAAAPSITPQPVILLDITSMFTTRLHHDVAAAPLKSVRRSMDTQTDCDPADSPHAAAAAAAAAVEQLQRDLDVTKRRLREAEAEAQAARRVIATTTASAVPTGPTALPGSSATASLADALADLSDAGVPMDGSKDLAELRRLRLLLRFSELKKDSDRLAGAEEALQESAATQLRLRQRCDRLEHEKAQRGDCLRAIASFLHTTLTAARADPPHLHRGGIGPFRTAAAAAATPTNAPVLSADVVAVLEYVLRLCTDAAPPTSTEPPHFTPMPPPPVPLPCASDDGEAWRQDRLHKAVVDGRSGAGGHRPPPCRPPSRRASWRAGGSSSNFAAAAGLGERRASKF